MRKTATSVIDRRGISLTELLVAVSIAMTFALAGWMFQRAQARELSNQAAELDGTEKIRSTMWFIAREIRRAGSDPRLTALVLPGYKGLSEARSDRILVQYDKDADGVIDTSATDPDAESILYFYDASSQEIRRTVAGTTQTLVEDVPPSGFDLQYFTLLDVELEPSGLPAILDAAARDLVTYVKINLRVVGDTNPWPTTLRLSSRVAIRSRILDKL